MVEAEALRWASRGRSTHPTRAARQRLTRCGAVAIRGRMGDGGQTVVDHIRLFPVRDDVRWNYAVHEQILPALRRANVPVRWTDVTVRHTGYAGPALREWKLKSESRTLLSGGLNQQRPLGRVALGITPQGSHRSRRADHPHRARHIADSLALARSGDLAVTPYEVRGPRGGSGLRSRDAAPPSLHGVREGPFPRFTATTECSDSLPSISPHFVSFAWRYHRCVPCLSPSVRDAGPGIILELVGGISSRLARWRRQALPSSQGIPRDHSPCSSTPA